MSTLTFNPSNWGDTNEVTATVTSLGHGDNTIKFLGMQFETSQYETNYGDAEGEVYSVCDLSHEGSIVASACRDGREWCAYENGGDLTRENGNPLVALLQVVANIF